MIEEVDLFGEVKVARDRIEAQVVALLRPAEHLRGAQGLPQQGGHLAVEEAVDHGHHEALDGLDEPIEQVVELRPASRVAHHVWTQHKVQTKQWNLNDSKKEFRKKYES